MSLQELVSNYGYLAISVGTFLEGETILILGGLAAHRGFLQLPWVVVCAFLGAFSGNQLYFHIGRHKGEKLLAKRPAWQAKSAKVFAMAEKHQVWLILGFSFIYGVRTVTPFLLGVAGVSPLRFFLLSILGTLAWATVVANVGYFFGYALEAVLGNVKQYELLIFGVFAGVGILIWLIRHLRHH
ncbi:MAG: DedA family protein [Halioglobus sp.]|nr:DedA family protein [Halioglobus sp.]